MLAQRRGLRIYEVPVAWTEDPDSKVELVRTALDDLRGVARLRFRPAGSRPPAPGGRPPLPVQAGQEPETQCRSAQPELTAPEQPR
jgi:hypothetical protein